MVWSRTVVQLWRDRHYIPYLFGSHFGFDDGFEMSIGSPNGTDVDLTFYALPPDPIVLASAGSIDTDALASVGTSES